MPLFAVQFEDVAFHSQECEVELSDMELLGYNETMIAEGNFPEGVKGVLKAYATPDDSVYEEGKDEEGDYKSFVCINLLIEADDADEAMDFDPPEDLLTKVTDMISTDLDLEGNWENTDSERYVPAPSSMPTAA